MNREPDFKKRYALWERVQTTFYAEAPRLARPSLMPLVVTPQDQEESCES